MNVRMFNRRIAMLMGAAFAGIVAATPSVAQPQDYPSKNVRIIIPFSPGGAADTLLRMMANALGKHWGQTVIVENRAGGNTIIGATAAAKSAPDGYTLFFTGDQTITINPLLTKAPYDVGKDFVPVSLIALNPLLLAVTPDLGVNSVQEFIALAKAKPKTILYGSSGPGSVQRLAMEHFAQTAGIELVHVPYRGANETVAGMLTGSVQATFNGVSNFVQLLPTGKVRALAVAAGHRSQQVPDVPTVREAGGPGLKDYETLSWFGLLAPTGVPQDILKKIQADIALVLKTPEAEKQLQSRGFELIASTAPEFQKIIADDTAKWREVIKKGNITAE